MTRLIITTYVKSKSINELLLIPQIMKTHRNNKEYEKLLDIELDKLDLENTGNKEKKTKTSDIKDDFSRDFNRLQIKIVNNSILAGFISAAALFTFFILLNTLLGSFEHTVDLFVEHIFWMSALILGFGIQIGLFIYIRQTLKLRKKIFRSSRKVAATGGLTTFSMVACCVHHLTDVLPFIGASTAAFLLAKYQIWFIILAVVSNILGIAIMLRIIYKNKLYTNNNSFFIWLEQMDIKKAVYILAVLSTVVLIFSSLVFLNPENNPDSSGTFATKVDEQNYVTVRVTPIDFGYDDKVQFNIEMDTHSVDLNYDITAVSILEDSSGKLYNAVSWSGSPEGGHHRKGKLIFPSVDDSTEYIKLIIKNINGVDRVFTWNIK